MSDRGVGGGFGASLQRLLRAGQDAIARTTGNKESKEAKDTKGADAKGEVKGEAKSGGPGGVKGKAKAKGKDLGAIGSVIGGADDFTLEDEEDSRRRRRTKAMLGDEAEGAFTEQDGAAERSAVAHISAEFRAQVASGMVAGRSFTQGSCIVPENGGDEEEEEADRPRRRKRR